MAAVHRTPVSVRALNYNNNSQRVMTAVFTVKGHNVNAEQRCEAAAWHRSPAEVADKVYVSLIFVEYWSISHTHTHKSENFCHSVCVVSLQTPFPERLGLFLIRTTISHLSFHLNIHLFDRTIKRLFVFSMSNLILFFKCKQILSMICNTKTEEKQRCTWLFFWMIPKLAG